MPRLAHDVILRGTAALASAGVGIIHLAVARDHMESWWVSGTFFIALGIFQIVWGPVALRIPTRAVLGAGALVSIGSVILWAITRSPIGQPAGPLAGTQLPIGPAGVISSVLELVVAAAVVWALMIRTPRKIGAVVPLVLAGVVVAALTAPGVSAALEHDHAGHADSGTSDSHGHDDEMSDDHMTDENPTESPSGGDTTEGPKSGNKKSQGAKDGTGADAHEDDGHGH